MMVMDWLDCWELMKPEILNLMREQRRMMGTRASMMREIFQEKMNPMAMPEMNALVCSIFEPSYSDEAPLI